MPNIAFLTKSLAYLRARPQLQRRLSDIGLGGLLLLALACFATILNRHLPFQDWLFFRYASYFFAGAVLVLSSLSLGLLFVSATLGRHSSVSERLVLGFPIGLFLFVFGWSCLGFLQLYSSWTALLWPCVALSLGARPLWRLARQSRALWFVRSRGWGAWSAVEIGLFVVGVLGVLLMYAPIMTPQNIAFDARWYHLPLAERYAMDGGITHYPEGWFLAGYPHFSSHLYSWAFLLPYGRVFDHIEQAAHLEFVVFLWTIGSVPLLVRRLVPARVRVPRNTWAVVFFFPGQFIYDSALCGGADHIAALWAAPVFLASMRAYRRLSVGTLLPLGVLICGVAMTKFTALGLLVAPGLALSYRLVERAVQLVRSAHHTKRSLLGLLAGPAALLLLLICGTSPYWLKNWVYYHNPFFPLMAERFASRPWTPEAAARLTAMANGANWTASHDLVGAKKTLQQLWEFSFIPNNWWTFHRDLPVFGSLFTLLTPVLLFVRTKRLVLLTLASCAGVLFYYWTFHQDRYLQAYLPWMAAMVAGVSVLLLKRGVVVRCALACLVLLQLVWGGDTPFFGTHAMSGQPLQATLQLLNSGFHGVRDERFGTYPEMDQITEIVGKDARVLRHETQMHLGITAPTVSDWFQSGISWTDAHGAADVHQVLLDYGITHIFWRTRFSMAFDSLGGDLLFLDYALHAAGHAKKAGGFSVATLAAKPPTNNSLPTLYLGCGKDYKNGLYEAHELKVIPFLNTYPAGSVFPRPFAPLKNKKRVAELLKQASALAWNEECFQLPQSPGSYGFTLAAKRNDGVKLWLKRPR